VAGIFCNHCGARLDESATLLPDERLGCPTCGSQSRRFELTIGQAVETDTALPITPLMSRTTGSRIITPRRPPR
jgi:hypothetical protein